MFSPFEIHGPEMGFCCFFLGHFLAPALLSTLIIGSFAKNLEIKRKRKGVNLVVSFIGIIDLGIFDAVLWENSDFFHEPK
jgi:hypothetical protein